jgi:hypothetical protein
VGGAVKLGHAWAPVADLGTVGGHGLTPSPGLGGRLVLGTAGALGPLAVTLAALAAGCAADQPAAAEARTR